jgi:hypothetical protein
MDHCKLNFSTYYRNASVEFMQRQTNEIAHSLANATTLSANF